MLVQTFFLERLLKMSECELILSDFFTCQYLNSSHFYCITLFKEVTQLGLLFSKKIQRLLKFSLLSIYLPNEYQSNWYPQVGFPLVNASLLEAEKTKCNFGVT